MARADGQLLSSLGYTSSGTSIAVERLRYGYEPGSNMTNHSVNGAGTTYGDKYDGNRALEERDNANTPIVAYTRGSDLSGSLTAPNSN